LSADSSKLLVWYPSFPVKSSNRLDGEVMLGEVSAPDYNKAIGSCRHVFQLRFHAADGNQLDPASVLRSNTKVR